MYPARPVAFALALALLPAVTRAGERPEPSRGLLAAYALDGDAQDAVTGERARAFSVRPAPGHDGRPQGALYFDGFRSYLDLGPRLAPDAFTVSAWIRPEALDRLMVVVSKIRDVPGHQSRNLELRINPGGRPFLHVPGGRAWDGVEGTQPLASGQWTHLAATYDGTQAQLWVNGVRDGRSLNVNYAQSFSPVFVGARPDLGGRRPGPGFFFRGAIEDVRVWDRALAEWELLAVAGRGPLRPPAPPPPPPPPPGSGEGRPWGQPGDDEGREETSFLLRVDRLILGWDAACAEGDGGRLDQVEARLLHELERGEEQARAERNERVARDLRRAAVQLGGQRGRRDPAALDRKRLALSRLAEALWGDLLEELPAEGLAPGRPRRPGPWY